MTNWAKRFLSKLPWCRIGDAAYRMLPTWQEFQILGDCFKHLRRMPTCLRQWWRGLSLERRHFLGNLMIGLSIVLLLNIFHNAPFRREAEDVAMDRVMRMRKGSVPNKPTLPLGWIDIDDKTYLDWNEPLYVPREKLADLIKFALESQPKMVVVDVDLAQRSHDKTLEEPIEEVLAKHADKCRGKPLVSEGYPPVVLLASLRPSEKGLPVQRTSNLDKLVEGSQHIFWASPLFDKDWDQTIRRWRIWEAVWQEANNRPAALPSIQLLAATLLTGREGAMEGLQSCLDSIALEGYTTTAEQAISGDKPPCTVTLWDGFPQRKMELSLPMDQVERRILYAIPWQTDAAGTSGSTIPTVRTTGDQERLLLSRISARNVRDKQGMPGNSDFKGRVVFIGGSFRDGRDIHSSPLGEMPGVLILINSLNSLLQQKAHEVCLPLKVLFEILLITLLSIAFSVWGSFWGIKVVNLTIIFVLLPVSVWLFGYGLWLDFALPLAAIQIYQKAVAFEKIRAARRVTVRVKSRPRGGSLGS